MIWRIRIILMTLCLSSVPAWAMQRAEILCSLTGTVTVSGLASTNKAVIVYPSCKIAVYNAGTTALATIYSDNHTPPTIKGNPFTADTAGHGNFYAPLGRYDITISGGGMAQPYTIGDFLMQDVSNVVGIPGAAAGPPYAVQYNNGGVLGGSPALLFDGANLTAGSSVSIGFPAGVGLSNNMLACLSNGAAIACPTTARTWIGIVFALGGGNAALTASGQAQCVFDGQSIIGHAVVVSPITAGNCHDAGSSGLAYGGVGQVLSANTGAGTNALVAMTPNSSLAWPSNCAGSNYMVYNSLLDSCIVAGPVGASGQVQVNNGGQWAVVSGLTYDFVNNILQAPNANVSGKVGIGTTTPGAPLDVNGVIHTKTLNSDGSVSAQAFYGPVAAPFSTPQLCPASTYWLAPVGGGLNNWYQCNNGTITPLGGVQSAVTSINSTAGAFTFTGAGVSCVGATCTFSAGGGGGTPPFAISTLTNGVIYKGNAGGVIQPSQIDDGATSPNTVTVGSVDTGGIAALVFRSTDTTYSSSWTGGYTGTDPTAPLLPNQVRMEVHSSPAAAQKVDIGQAPFPFFLEGATGAITAIIANGQYGPHLLPRAALLENITATAATFTCSVNPVITLEDCGTSAGTCAAPTALANVTLTAANTIVLGTVVTAGLSAGHYFVFKTTAGTCTVLDATMSALAHSGTE